MSSRTDLVFPVNSHPDLVNGTTSSPHLYVSNGMSQGAEVSTSSQGKGVGVFALSASSGVNVLAMEDQMKDPKVNLLFLKNTSPSLRASVIIHIFAETSFSD